MSAAAYFFFGALNTKRPLPDRVTTYFSPTTTTPLLAKSRKDLFSDTVSIRAWDEVSSFRFGKEVESKAENLPPPIFKVIAMGLSQLCQRSWLQSNSS